MSAINSKHARMPISHVVALEISQHSADLWQTVIFKENYDSNLNEQVSVHFGDGLAPTRQHPLSESVVTQFTVYMRR